MARGRRRRAFVLDPHGVDPKDPSCGRFEPVPATPSFGEVKTSSGPSADSHVSVLASQPLVHLAILAVVVGIVVAIYLTRRGKS